MRILLATVALSVLPAAAIAQDMPKFMQNVVPEASAAPAWQEYMAVMNPKGALDDKTKQLIALGVAAQIPCQYYIYGHTVAAKKAGATDAQIKEAVGAAALVRAWSIMLNGNRADFGDFKKEIDAAYGVIPSQ